MIAVLDTNVLPGIFTVGHPYREILRGWLGGRFIWAFSTDILLEYEEVLTHLMGQTKTTSIFEQINAVSAVTDNVLHISPAFAFLSVPGDRDDDKFADCAITAHAEWIVTEDKHFDSLIGSGYKPQPITPEEFIRRIFAGT